MNFISLVAYLFLALTTAATVPTVWATPPKNPKLVLPEKTFNFGEVRRGDVIEHAFILKNQGNGELRFTKVDVSGPIVNISITKEIPAQQEGKVVLTFDAMKVNPGAQTASAILHTNDPSSPRVELRMEGKVKPPAIIYRPLKAIFLTAFRGEAKEQTITITNNEEKPLDIFAMEAQSTRFKAELATVMPGKEYKLTVKVNPNAEYGRFLEEVLLFSDHKEYPEIKIPINLFVKTDVFTFPDVINFGKLKLEDLRKSPKLAESFEQTILVKRRASKGGDFQISIEPGVPIFAVIKTPKSGAEVYRLDVSLVPEKLKPGKIDTFIRVKTNDKEVPELKIPVVGEVL